MLECSWICPARSSVPAAKDSAASSFLNSSWAIGVGELKLGQAGTPISPVHACPGLFSPSPVFLLLTSSSVEFPLLTVLRSNWILLVFWFVVLKCYLVIWFWWWPQSKLLRQYKAWRAVTSLTLSAPENCCKNGRMTDSGCPMWTLCSFPLII